MATVIIFQSYQKLERQVGKTQNAEAPDEPEEHVTTQEEEDTNFKRLKKKSYLGVDGVKSQRSRIHGGRGRGRRKRAIENRGGGQETRLDNLLWALLIGTGEAEERFGSLGHESPHFLYTPDDPVRRVME